jgi:hypothetical protein
MRLMRAWMTHGTAVVMGVTSRSVRSVASHRRRAAASGSRTTARSSSCRARDSNLRARLRRGLLCIALTSGNKLPNTMIGSPSGQGAWAQRTSMSASYAVLRIVLRHVHAFQHRWPPFTTGRHRSGQ